MSTNPSTSYCTSCGKALSTGRGTFTAWIFGGAKCNCGSAAANDAIPNSLPRKLGTTESLALPANGPEFSVGDKYEILECIGRGGMGAVYQVRDVNLDKVLAVKALHPALAADRFALKRFEQEAEAALSLTHANLVAVYDHGVSDNGAPYLVMDYVDGESLSDALKKEVYFEPMRALDIASQICEALAHAHSKGIIHRDIKPSNVILAKTADGHDLVKVIDFGIAKILPTVTEQTNNLTHTGEIFGSPLYMSPEQCQGAAVDARSDIYSLGCVLYELLTGRAPFSGANPIQIILSHLHELPRLVSVAFPSLDISTEVATIVGTCLEKNPLRRYQSVEELFHDIELVRSGFPPVPRVQELAVHRLEVTSAWRRYAAAIADASLAGLVGQMLLTVWMPLSHTLHSGLSVDNGAVDHFLALGAFFESFVDYLLVFPLPAELAFLSHFARTVLHADLSLLQTRLDFCAALIAFNWLYGACMESSERRATLGMQLFGLKIESPQGAKLTFTQATIRHFSRALWLCGLTDLVLLPAYACANRLWGTQAVGFEDALFRRPLHDRIANAVVVCKPMVKLPALKGRALTENSTTKDVSTWREPQYATKQKEILGSLVKLVLLASGGLVFIPGFVYGTACGVLLIAGFIFETVLFIKRYRQRHQIDAAPVASGKAATTSVAQQSLLIFGGLVDRAWLVLAILTMLAPGLMSGIAWFWWIGSLPILIVVSWLYVRSRTDIRKSAAHLSAKTWISSDSNS